MRNLCVIIMGALILLGGAAATRESSAAQTASPAGQAANTGQVTNTAPVAVPGQTGKAAPMTDIHDIKPLVSVPVPISLAAILLWGGIGLLAAAVLLGGWFLWKRRRGKTVESVTAMLSPEDTAFQQLSALSPDTANGKAFYFALSAIFRQYLEGRFGIDGLEMTTEELLPHVETLPLERDLKRDAKKFLVSSDPVKFAGLPACLESMESDLGFVRSFVETSAASLQAAEEEAGPPDAKGEMEQANRVSI